MRTSRQQVNQYLEKELLKTLYQTVADLRKPEEAEEFLNSFLSKAERLALAKRIAVAYWLDKGRGYSNIRENLKVSSATIADMQTRLKNSKGIGMTLQKIKAEEWANQWAAKIKKFTGIK